MTLKTSRRNTEEYSQRELSGVGTARYRMTEKRKGDWATEGYEVALLCHVSAAGMHMWRLRSKEHQFTVNQTPRGCIGMKKKKRVLASWSSSFKRQAHFFAARPGYNPPSRSHAKCQENVNQPNRINCEFMVINISAVTSSSALWVTPTPSGTQVGGRVLRYHASSEFVIAAVQNVQAIRIYITRTMT